MPKMESFVRPLSEKEHRLLKAVLKNRQKQLSGFVPRLLRVMTILVGGLWALTRIATFKRNVPFLIPTILWIGFATLLYIWIYVTQKPKLRAEVERFREALAKNEAQVVRIQAEEMIEFEEEEDEGADYAFQVEGNRIVFVCGQDFYSSAKFPNSDFSLVHIYDTKGELLEMLIEKAGTKLKPLRKIPAALKSRMIMPEHLRVLDGTLANLEELLARK